MCLIKMTPLAFKIKPLNDAYKQAVLENQEINTGIFGLAHVKYWNSPDMHTIIGRKLAIDWIRLNNKLSTGDVDSLYQQYDQNLGL